VRLRKRIAADVANALAADDQVSKVKERFAREGEWRSYGRATRRFSNFSADARWLSFRQSISDVMLHQPWRLWSVLATQEGKRWRLTMQTS